MKIRLDRGVIRWWLIALGLFVARPGLVPGLAGTGLVALGMLIHLWSKGCLQQNRQLTVCGPYRWSRNPFYVANFLIDFGLCLFINCLWLTVPFAVVWAIVYRWQILSEERTLEGIYGQGWTDYKKSVAAFFPYKRPYRDVPAGQGFSWSNPNLSQSREVPRLIRTAAYPLLLLAAGNVGPRMWVHLHRAGLDWRQCFGWLGSATGMSCLASIVAMLSFAAVLKKQLHSRQPALPEVLRRHGVQLGLVLIYLACLTINRGAIHPNPYVAGLGIFLLLLGFVAIQRRQKKPGLAWDAIAWCAALGGAGLLAGLPWATILAVTCALAICIDSHIGAAWSLAFPDFNSLSPDQPAVQKPLWDRLGLATYYTLFSLAVLAIALGKANG